MTFEYQSIEFRLSLGNGDSEAHGVDSGASVQLYGNVDHEGTILVLKPGEWIRVKTKVLLHKWPSVDSVRMEASLLLRRITYVPHPGGSFEKIEIVNSNQTPTPWSDSIRLIQSNLNNEEVSRQLQSSPN